MRLKDKGKCNTCGDDSEEVYLYETKMYEFPNGFPPIGEDFLTSIMTVVITKYVCKEHYLMYELGLWCLPVEKAVEKLIPGSKVYFRLEDLPWNDYEECTEEGKDD